jgi:hypothetical protein
MLGIYEFHKIKAFLDQPKNYKLLEMTLSFTSSVFWEGVQVFETKYYRELGPEGDEIIYNRI